MGAIRVDETKCKRDGICVTVCPVSVIEQKKKGDVPTQTANALSTCIECYHCVAACPHGALANGNVDADHCLPLKKEHVISSEQAEAFLCSHRSIRQSAIGAQSPQSALVGYS